jgi:hypothetical protein
MMYRSDCGGGVVAAVTGQVVVIHHSDGDGSGMVASLFVRIGVAVMG